MGSFSLLPSRSSIFNCSSLFSSSPVCTYPQTSPIPQIQATPTSSNIEFIISHYVWSSSRSVLETPQISSVMICSLQPQELLLSQLILTFLLQIPMDIFQILCLILIVLAFEPMSDFTHDKQVLYDWTTLSLLDLETLLNMFIYMWAYIHINSYMHMSWRTCRV